MNDNAADQQDRIYYCDDLTVDKNKSALQLNCAKEERALDDQEDPNGSEDLCHQNFNDGDLAAMNKWADDSQVSIE